MVGNRKEWSERLPVTKNLKMVKFGGVFTFFNVFLNFIIVLKFSLRY